MDRGLRGSARRARPPQLGQRQRHRPVRHHPRHRRAHPHQRDQPLDSVVTRVVDQERALAEVVAPLVLPGITEEDEPGVDEQDVLRHQAQPGIGLVGLLDQALQLVRLHPHVVDGPAMHAVPDAHQGKLAPRHEKQMSCTAIDHRMGIAGDGGSSEPHRRRKAARGDEVDIPREHRRLGPRSSPSPAINSGAAHGPAALTTTRARTRSCCRSGYRAPRPRPRAPRPARSG